jgi:hypothetical protein
VQLPAEMQAIERTTPSACGFCGALTAAKPGPAATTEPAMTVRAATAPKPMKCLRMLTYLPGDDMCPDM